MTCPRERVASNYSFRTADEESGKSIGFREVCPDRDLGRLHTWFNSEHVLPYWQQNDPLPQVRDTIASRHADEDQTLYIGYLDHTPMSYWESYWAGADRLSEHYDADPADQGFHVLIGPPEYLGHGYAEPLLKAMTAFLFEHRETERIVVEPDARNETITHVLEQCGFKAQREIDFSEKTGLFMICERETFEREIV
jgi:acetyl CoA:N6-hydroxylysine acetyl transferase